MIQTHQFIGQLSIALRQRLKDAIFATCFSQNKDELIMGFAHEDEDFYIIADLVPEVCLLYFPKEFHRARKNSVDLFEPAIGLKVTDVITHPGERSFHIELEKDFLLMFKMHGRNANVILFEAKKAIHIFKNNLENDWNTDIEKLKTGKTEVIQSPAIDDPVAFANAHFEQFKKHFYLDHEKEGLVRQLKARITKTNAYLEKTKQKEEELAGKSGYEKWANILMANVHLKTENQSEIVLFDFYENKDITIKLKKELSLQKNAEIYYRKSKNQKIEKENIAQNIAVKKTELDKSQQLLLILTAIEDLKSLRQFAKENKFSSVAADTKQELPFKTFDMAGFQILVGKNAANNDLLTFKYTFKEDLWLHAKDVSGSHVVIKYQSGKVFPKNVIEKAAQLAAYYSKRKTDSLVPVITTPKKYVRKPKGLPAGKVIVEREDIILVEPKNDN